MTAAKRALLSFFIVAFLGLQAWAALGPYPDYMGSFYWPFLNYPMYSPVYKEGAKIDDFRLFGVREDGSEVAIDRNDLGFNWFKFQSVIKAIVRGREDRVALYRSMYEKNRGTKLAAFRLENHAWSVMKQGPVPVPREVVREVRFHDGGEA